MDTNTATIISGILSMLGGIAGAGGAYWAANSQIKKQFKKNDDDRALELRINKLNEALMIVNDYSSALNGVKGKFYTIELNVDEILKTDHTFITKDNALKEPEFSELKRNINQFESFKNDLKKQKIFVGDVIKYEEIYTGTSEIIESYKTFLKYFDNEKGSTRAEEFSENYKDKLSECNGKYDALNRILSDSNSKIELEILRLLKVK